MPKRRKARPPSAERGETVVRRTLDAARDELARVGYASLRIDDVATRAKVNKTTIYRRWPTKESLVRAALLALAERTGGLALPDTGSLRGDLTELVERQLRFARSPQGSAIIRVLGEDPSAELVAITQSLRSERDAITRTILERARARGSLRANVDTVMFVDLMQVACDRARLGANRVAPKFVKTLLDVLLYGAMEPRAYRNSELR